MNEATQQIMNQPDDEDEDYNSGYSNGSGGNSGYSSGGSTSGGGTSGGSTGGDSYSGGGTTDNDPDTSYTPDVPSGGGDSGESDYIE